MKRFIKLSIVAATIIAIATPIFGITAKRNNDADITRNLDVFNSLYKELNMYYVDTINAQKTIETAIGSMLNDIDPYTEYIPPKDQEDFLIITTGEYGGIGSYIMESKGNVYISEPYEGSPAHKAGLRAGDKIIMIDNDSVAKWGREKVSEHLKGQANTKLRVVVQRPYSTDSIIPFEIMREKIQVNSVPYYGLVRGNVGYISLTSFNEKSPNEVKNALLELKKNDAVKSIVIDLRGNGGGLLESAVQIVGLFTPKNTEVLKTRGRLMQSEKTYKTTQEPIDTKIPLAVLIDGGSASSAEIVAGALQDLDRAVILGARSYGKGLVQTTRPLPFDGLLKVTIAKYYIPSGRLIQAIDYSHRNADGSVARIPDSLTTVYKTDVKLEMVVASNLILK
ncbi:MAG: S41 family peptidase [Muribaculaceae bacterium]